MTLSARAIEDLLRSLLPAGDESFELRLAPVEEPVADRKDGSVVVHVILLVFEPGGQGQVRDKKEQELFLLNAEQRADEGRSAAYLRAWARAIPVIAARQFGDQVDMMMPHDLVFSEAFYDAGAREEADFAALFESAEWLARCLHEREVSEFADAMAYFGVAEHTEELWALRRPSIRLVVDAERHADDDDEGEDEDVEDEEDTPVGASKIGGLPDLPPGVEWPRIEGYEMAFLAQIRLADLRGLAGAEDLPDDGLLVFFHGVARRLEGHWNDYRGETRVIHFAGDPATFVRARPPSGTRRPDGTRVWPEYPVLRQRVEWTMPAIESPFYEVLDDEPHDNDWYFKFARVAACSEHDEERPIHRLLGYTSELQGDPYLEAHMYSTGQDFAGWDRNGARERGLQREATRWRLLLQVDSAPGDLLWQDGGFFYFLIREDDLAARRFDQVWGVSHGH